MIKKENITKTELEKLAKKHFGRIGHYTTTEDNHRIHIYTSLAKKTTPMEIRALGNMEHVHVATFVPYKKRGFVFTNMKKHVKNLPKNKKYIVMIDNDIISKHNSYDDAEDDAKDLAFDLACGDYDSIVIYNHIYREPNTLKAMETKNGIVRIKKKVKK